jgi:type II secretory pathway component GspD/PulD (secretin)
MRATFHSTRLKLRLAVAWLALALCSGNAAGVRAQTRFQQQQPPAAFIPAQPVPQSAASAQAAAAAPSVVANPAASSPKIEDVLAAALKAAGLASGPAAPAVPAAPVQTEMLPDGSPGEAPIMQADEGLLIPLHGDDPDNAVVKDDDNGLVSLMVRQGSLRHVVAMIAETQKLNIVFAGQQDEQVTATFDRQPWQNVLDSLLAASGYSWTTRGNVIFVSRVDNASYIPPGAEAREVEVFDLDFASASDIDQAVKGLLSPAGKSWIIETSSTDNRRTKETIAVVDYPAYLGRISDYICQADQPPRQVMIEAHVLQVELTDDCRNGVNFNNLISLSSAGITLKSIGFANTQATNAFFIDAQGTGLDGLVELLKNTTDAKTLASPRLMVVSGQESHIQIGEKLGYRVTTTTQTSTLESVQFLDVGVVLKVIPRVTRDGRVIMRVMPKVSTGQVVADTGLPAERTAETETDVLLDNGQGMVIGGLIQEKDSNVQSKLPFLGDLPYVGILFQKRQVIKSRSEIIVALQPHVLPYSPIDQTRNDAAFIRATQPLTERAIYRYPRPYEPRLPDTFYNHKHKHKWDDWWAPEDIVNNFGPPPCDVPSIYDDYEQFEEIPAEPEPEAAQDNAADIGLITP